MPVLPRLGAWAVSMWTCALAAPALAVGAAATQGIHALRAPSATEAAMIAFLTVGSTAIGFVTWYAAVARIGADLAALIAGAVPVVTLFAGAGLGSDRITVPAVIGCVVVSGGLLLGVRTPAPATRSGGTRRLLPRRPGVTARP